MTNIVLLTLVLKAMPLIYHQENRGARITEIGAHGEVGQWQIRQCVLDDLKRFKGIDIKLEACWDDKVGEYVCQQYLLLWGERKKVTTIEQLCRIFNGGPNGATKRGTVAYWKEIKARNKGLV